MTAPRLRRPSDLAREGPAGGRPERLAWPEGFAEDAADRQALFALTCLASLTARRLLELAVRHRTAGGCLAAGTRVYAGIAPVAVRIYAKRSRST